MRSARLAFLLAVAAACAAVLPASLATRGVNAAGGGITFGVPRPGHPDVHSWQGAVLDSPLDSTTIATPDLTKACDPKLCEDTKLTVPGGLATSTLYVKVQWHHAAWKLYMSAIEPDGTTVHGGAVGCDANRYDKGCGNETTQAFDEVTIPQPKPGVWTVRVIAINIHNEPYTGITSLTASSPLQYAQETLKQLTAHLTRTQRVNLVFVGWKPSDQDIKDMLGSLTTQHQPSAVEKQFGDCNASGDLPAAYALVQGGICHYTGTDPTTSTSSSTVPYMEPLTFNIDYHFLAADDTYTKGLFAAMKAATRQDQAFSVGRVPLTPFTAPFKTAYLTQYNAAYGASRAADKGPDHAVADTSVVDMIDAVTTEDWIQNHRLDQNYARSFTDLRSGAVTGAQFLNPDPTAVRDPFWDGNGTRAASIDTDPQGANTGLSFFFLDTWDPAYATDYFRPDHYHTFSTFDHVKDPDTGHSTTQDNMRGYGGSYRFQFLDLGAAPSSYERSNWLSANVNPEDGSSYFDPPLWQWHADPFWNGTNPQQGSLHSTLNVGGVGIPYHYAGDTLGAVLGFETTMGLGMKYLGSYLYRPIPNDVYIVNTLQVIDHYSLPATEGGQDLYHVNLDKVADPVRSLRGVSSAAPYDFFSPQGLQHLTLGCAQYRFVLNSQQTGGHQVADPSCTSPDGLQQAVEDAKANGGAIAGAGLPDYAVDQDFIRDYIDHHRDKYAPLVDGAFSVPVFNVMFEKSFNVALPLLAGGIASGVNGGEGWGQFDNVNDNLVPTAAIDCSKSVPGSPGCNGVSDQPFRHDYYLSYVVIHETSHFLGLNHPHDGAVIDTKAADGSWTYEAQVLKWLYDLTASPTTYAYDYTQYESVDQERLMYGHAAEYLRQRQDWLADAYWTDGAAGRTSPSANTLSRVDASTQYRDLASALFRQGDYLHTQYAMKDAALYAKGVSESQVAPHRLSVAEAGADRHAFFAIHPQAVYNPDAGVATVTTTVPGGTGPAISGAPTALSNTGRAASGSTLPVALMIAVGVGLLAWTGRGRRRTGTGRH